MPSLYESTVNTGEVSSSNFTTLYNASGLQVPNAGAGSVTGNLNVGGNLTVQGSSLLIGEVTLQSTLSLPNYTFPAPDGTTDQVLVTDGNGNLYWTDVNAIPGADYSISATTVAGGANITLENTAGFTDSVKLAAGTNIGIVRTDANTITISTTADDIPSGTVRGQVLYWDGSAWTASANIRSATANDRLVVTYENTAAGSNSALFLRKDFGASNYSEATNDGVSLNYSVKSDSQGTNSYGVVNFEYSATDPQFTIASSTTNFASADTLLLLQKSTANLYASNITLNAYQAGTPTLNATITAERGSSTNATLTWNEATDTWEFTNNALVEGDLAVNGGDLTTVSATGNLFNANAVVVNVGNGATTEVNLGNIGSGRVQIKSPTIVGANTTQNVFDTVATTVNAFGAATAVNIGAATGVTTIEHDLTVQGGNINLNGAATAGQQPFLTFADQANTANPQYGIRGKSGLTDPWFVGAGSTGSDQGYLEIATGDNAGDPSGTASPIYARQYNGYASGGVPWYGGSGTVVNEFTLLDGDGNTSIPNNLTVGGTISTEGVTLNLTTPVHQGQFLYVSNDVTPTITNSSLINFTDLTYRPNFQAKTGVSGRTQSGVVVSNNTGAVNYTTGDGASLLMGIDSDAQTQSFIGAFTTAYDVSGDHQIRISTSASNFANDLATSITGGNTLVFPTAHGFSAGDKLQYTSATQNGLTYTSTYYVIATGLTTTQCQISATLGGSAVALTNGTGLTLWFSTGTRRVIGANSASVDLLAPTIVLNATNTGIPFAGTAGIEVERGTSGANSTFNWDETSDFWRASNDLYVDNYVIGGVGLATNGNYIIYNNENTSPSGDCNLTVKSGVSAGVNANFRWNDTTKRWQDTADGSTYYNLPNQNLDTNSDVTFNSVTVDGGHTTIDTTTTTTTSTALTAITTTSNATTRSSKFQIQVTDNVTGNIHVLEAMVFFQGTTAYLTTYAEMYNSASLATFSADVNSGNTRLLATPASANNTTFKVTRISVAL